MKIKTANGLIKFIDNIRLTDQYIETIFMQGGCYQFYLLLSKYCDCKPYINIQKNHVVAKLKGKYYDITGEVGGEYYPLTYNDLEMVKSWSFNNKMLLNIKNCPYCDEPITV